MKRLDIASRAGKNLRQAKVRTLLTSLAIAVGAFTIMASLMAGEGTRNYGENLLKSNLDPQSLFVVAEKSFFTAGPSTGVREYSEDLGQGAGGNIKLLNAKDIAKLRNLDETKQVTPVYRLSAKYVSFELKKDKKYSIAAGDYDPAMISDVVAGSVPKKGEQIADDEVLVPASVAKAIGISPEKLIGSTITVRVEQALPGASEDEIKSALSTGGPEAAQALLQRETVDKTLKIRAVLDASPLSFGTASMLQMSNNTTAELQAFQDKGSDLEGKFIGVNLTANDGVDTKALKQKIEKDLGFGAQTAEDAQSLLFNFIAVLQAIVGGFGVLALLASIFGIINTQYISVLERTSQIGLMKSLGMRGKDIGKLFRYEAAWVGLLGGLIGIALAYAGGIVGNPYITEALKLGDGNRLLEFVWWQGLILVISLILVAIGAGFFPSRRAAKLDPIEALRTE